MFRDDAGTSIWAVWVETCGGGGHSSCVQDLHQEAFQNSWATSGLPHPWCHSSHTHHSLLPWSCVTSDSKSGSSTDRAGWVPVITVQPCQPSSRPQAGAVRTGQDGAGGWGGGLVSSLEGVWPAFCIPFGLSWQPDTFFLPGGSLCSLPPVPMCWVPGPCRSHLSI